MPLSLQFIAIQCNRFSRPPNECVSACDLRRRGGQHPKSLRDLGLLDRADPGQRRDLQAHLRDSTCALTALKHSVEAAAEIRMTVAPRTNLVVTPRGELRIADTDCGAVVNFGSLNVTAKTST